MGGIKCPYCGRIPELVNDSVVYGGAGYGSKIWLCKPCDAYVKAKHNGDPNGIMAKQALRKVRKSIMDALVQIKASDEFKYRDAISAAARALGQGRRWAGVSWLDDKDAMPVLQAIKSLGKDSGAILDFRAVDFNQVSVSVIDARCLKTTMPGYAEMADGGRPGWVAGSYSLEVMYAEWN